MATIYEAHRSPDLEFAEKGEGGRATVTYIVLEVADAAAAAALAQAASSLIVLTGDEQLVRQRIRPRTIGVDSFEVDVEYGPEGDKESEKPPEPGAWKVSFDTTGGRVTRTVSRKTLGRFWNSDFGVAPDLKGAINWDGEKAAGVEIVVPSGKFTITAYYEARDVTTAFFRRMKSNTGQMNSDEWLGFKPGEVLFHGSTGEADIPTRAGQRVAPAAVQHQYETSDNLETPLPEMTASAVTHGDSGEITVRGFDYLWYRIMKIKHAATNHVVGRPAHAYVEELYPSMGYKDFFGFG